MPRPKFLPYPTYLWLLAILVIVTPLAAQEQISFRQLSIKDGLSQNSAISITQDSTGYLWIATQDGLNQYDGRSFTKFPFIFEDVTRPTYSRLGKVYVDRKGAVWCIPSSGHLYKMNPQTKQFEAINAIEGASVIYQDTDFNYWVGTYGKGLVVIDSMGQLLTGVSPIAIEGSSYDLLQVGDRMLAATDRGVHEVSISAKKLLYSLNRTVNGRNIAKKFSTIAVDHTGRQWFGTYGGGLYYREPGSGFLLPSRTLPLSHDLPSDLNILSLLLDSQNNLWVGTYGNALYRLDLQTYELRHFSPDKHNPKAIHYNDILCIYEDYTGTLWFGTDGAGASYYDAFLEKFNSITNFQVPSDIYVEVVRAIEADCQKSVWIGTSGKGLMQYHAQTGVWKKFTAETSGLLSDRIMSLFCTADGELLAGTQGGGLSRINTDGTVVNFLEEPGSVANPITIWNIFRDSQGRTWLGSREQGLLQFEEGRGIVRAYNADHGFEGIAGNIRVITEGALGELWLGTETDGLIRFNPDSGDLTSFRKEEDVTSLPSNSIKSLYYDPSGTLWVGTYGSGLSAMDTDNERFQTYDERDGLPNNVIYAILPDEQGNLWLSSNRGITRFHPPDSPDGKPAIVNYTNYEGLATEFNTGAYYKGNEGTLYFGGLEGFYWFDPMEIRNHTQLPKTVITGLQVANEPRPLQEALKLSHQENTLSFTFASLQFSLPEKDQYQYRLVNYDEAWVPAGNTNFARYSFLPPGDYEFQVLSSNYDGVWNQEPASFPFSIAPPWYASWWARLTYGLLLLTGIIAIFGYMKWRWQMKLKLQLQEEESQRLQHLNDFKTQLYTDISHEFRSPLSLIAAPVENKLMEGGLSETDYAELSMIKRNTNRLMDLVDQLLQLARLEKGKWPIRLGKADAALFIRTLVRAFEYKAEQNNILFHWEVSDTGPVWYDPDILEKILSNLLTNAMKYCPRGGSCYFDARPTEKGLRILVKNTVENASKIAVDRLFDRFYQGASSSSGTGIGLSLVRELLTLCRGTIEAGLEGDSIWFEAEIPTTADSIPGAEKVAATTITSEATVKREQGNLPTDSQEPADVTGLERPLLLLVEDHAEVREYLRRAWEDKYDILEASNGAEGIKKALEAVPDLVLTDVRMPVCSGIELCNTLKADERTSHIPVILLTSGGELETELKGLESGADDFITKPFKLPVLEKRVDNLIQLRRSLRDRYSQELTLQASDLAVTPTDEAFFNKVQDILDAHLGDAGFNATTFCQLVGMSRMQLHRKLQLYTGLSTTAFIRSQRLKQASKLIQETDLSVNEVAYMVGFNTPSYFIKCFREVYNTTPAAYASGNR